MMLFLVSLTDFHVFVDLFRVVLLLLHGKLLSCFLSIGYVSMEYPKRLYQIVMWNSHLNFGKSFLGYWDAGWHFLVLTTRKRMGWLSVFIAPLSRFCVATVLVHKNSGAHFLLSVSLLSTRRFSKRFRMYLLRWFTGLCQLYLLMYS